MASELSDSDKDTLELLAKLGQHLPIANDLDLLVLKGHLLVEEQIVDFIKRKATNPEHIISIQSTHIRILIAESLRELNSEPLLWAAVKSLNALRNKMAHNLEPPDFEEKVRTFVVEAENMNPEVIPSDSLDDELHMHLRFVIAAIIGEMFRLDPTPPPPHPPPSP